MGTVGEGALRDGIVFLPVRAAHVPVREPFLFGLEVLHLEVENTVMGDEGFEAAVVMSGNPIDAEAAEGSTYATEMVFVHIGFGAELIDGGEIIFHTLTSVVTGDLFVPFFAETGQTASVRRYDDIIAGGHHHEVPAERPELRNRALRTALAIEDGRIFLVRVEMRRIDDPSEHLFAVGGFLPTRYDGRTLNLRVDIIVLMGQLGEVDVSVDLV